MNGFWVSGSGGIVPPVITTSCPGTAGATVTYSSGGVLPPSPIMQRGAIDVWYCMACRRVLRTVPRGEIERGCRCEVPVLPKAPTRVWRA